MIRSLKRCLYQKHCAQILLSKCTFLTNEYKCIDAWNAQISSPLLTKVNLNDFYNILDQNFTSKGVISAIDVDIFANAIRDPAYLDELKDLLHKLRLSAETGNTLESTHHATIRNYVEFGNTQDLIEILKDPLNFGLFLDFYTANILLDKLIISENFDHASQVASFIMLQEDYTNDITNTLCQYACYKYLSQCKIPQMEPVLQEEATKKKDEIKIRIKFLRNPYFDDHFDIQDLKTLSGKTLAWISKSNQDNLNNNLQIIGYLFYKKYNQLMSLCKELVKNNTFKLYSEVIELLKKEMEIQEEEFKIILSQCIDVLSATSIVDSKLEHSIKIAVENAINRTQSKDISSQKQLFKNWEQIREDKLEEQSKRLDRAKRMKNIVEKQKEMQIEEQKLWFFKNEEDIDLQIEEKEKLEDTRQGKKIANQKSDENYIPPEILPKRK